DLSEVDAVAKNGKHRAEAPGPRATGAGGMAAFGEPVGYRSGAEALVGIEVEDDRNERSALGIDLQEVGGEDDRCVSISRQHPSREEAVAEGDCTSVPAAASGLALHSRNGPIDDGRSLELGKDGEHLNHHPAGGRASIEGLGSAAEDDTHTIQVVEDLGKA